MNKFTKLILTTAVFATSGFATTEMTKISGTVTYKEGWTITGSDASSIVSGATLTMGEDSGAASNISIEGSASLTNSGTLVMHNASAIKSASTADPAFKNSGTLNLENTKDFSNFSVKVSNSDGAKVIIPAPNANVTKGTNFTLSAPQGDSEEFTVEYAGGGKELSISGQTIVISDNGKGTYADKAAITTKTGIQFDDDKGNTKILNTNSESSKLSMNEVVAHAENKTENQDKTFDIGQEGLGSRDVVLTEAKTIHFGLVGASDKNMNVTGTPKLTLAGDNSGMQGKISAEGNVEFEGKAVNGDIDCEGILTLGYQGAQSLEGIINAKSLIIPSGSQITFTKKLTTGWEKVVNWTFDPDTMATASKKFGGQTYTIWKGKLYHSAGNNGSSMTKVDGAELIEIGEASDWSTDKRRSDGLALFPVNGKNILHSNEVKRMLGNNWDTMSTSYVSSNPVNTDMILTDGAYWYSPYTVYQLLAANPYNNYNCYALTSDKNHYMMKDNDGNWKWYKCEESEFDSIATIAERVLETAKEYNI